MPLPRTHRLLTLSAVGALLVALAVANPAAASTATFTQPGVISTADGGNVSQGAEGAAAPIPDAGTEWSGAATSVIRLEPVAGRVATSVQVQVTITHQRLDDLDLVLVAPDGRAVTLASDMGGASDGTTTLTFDDMLPPFPDEALATGGAPVDYDTLGDRDDHPGLAPASLRSLGGVSTDNVAWTLFAYDDTIDNTGSIDNWFLSVLYGAPAAPNPSPLSVTGSAGNVTDVNLVLQNVDGRPYDTEFLLESPGGRYAHVISDIVDEGDELDNVTLRLDDEATEDVPRLDAPVSGSYRPHNYDDGDQSEFFGGVDTMDMDARLSTFDGDQANGVWKLWVFQEFCCELVTIGGWSLEITTEEPPVPLPAPPAGPSPQAPTAPTPSVADTVSPTITRTTPAHRARRVRPDASLTITFSEEMRVSSFSKRTVRLVSTTGTKVRAALRYRAGKHLVVVDPTKRLAPDSTYTLTVTTGATDLAGNPLSRAKKIRFRTR